jgi:hypothetical protein
MYWTSELQMERTTVTPLAAWLLTLSISLIATGPSWATTLTAFTDTDWNALDTEQYFVPRWGAHRLFDISSQDGESKNGDKYDFAVAHLGRIVRHFYVPLRSRLFSDFRSAGPTTLSEERGSDPRRLRTDNQQQVVPLPAAAWLFASALAGMAGIGYRRKRQALRAAQDP